METAVALSRYDLRVSNDSLISNGKKPRLLFETLKTNDLNDIEKTLWNRVIQELTTGPKYVRYKLKISN